MIFTPSSNLNDGTTYTITINTPAEDLAGNNLQSPYTWQFTTAEPDTTAPIISNVQASPAGSSATITWATDEIATSQIEYGATTAYGSSTTLDTNLATAHSQVITGLNPATAYHYRVKSKDASNNSATSTDYTFTTTEQPADLVAYWNFNEGTGTTAADSSGNNNDGTLVNNPAWVNGKIGKAISFDGSNDFVDCGDNPAFNLGGTKTVEFWAKFPVNEIDKRIIAFPVEFAGAPIIVQHGLKVSAVEIVNASSSAGRTTSNNVITLNQWHHIAAVYDGVSSANTKIYIDGISESVGSTPWNYYSKSGNVFIGGRQDNSAHFNGSIDNIRVYSRALTPAEILANYNEAQDTTPPSRSNGSPTGVLSSGTTETTISLTTDEQATCKYSTSPGTVYGSMPNTFTTTNSTSHSQTITGLTDGQSYAYYVKCQDTINNSNSDDYSISFSIASSPINHNPIGALDGATESLITGWAYDEDAGANSIDVHIYIDGSLATSVTANESRPDLVDAGVCPDPNHGFSYVPEGLSVGTHTVSVYAINQPTGDNPELTDSPKTFTVSPSDTTPPTISNIQSTNITTNSATITWTTDENSTSQIEYGLTAAYGSQTTKDETLITSHSVNLSSLSDNTTYHYRVISEDELNNSAQSTDQTFTTEQASVPDTTPPANITNLSSSNITQTSADLSWTAPGDDNNTGTAAAYDLRYATTTITEANWNQATQVSGEPTPQTSNNTETFIITGLSPNTTYYLAIKTADEIPNWSNISNVVSFTTEEEDDGNGGGGGGGGGGTVSDTTPPAQPANFKATGANKQILLTWTNPSDSDFVRIKLLRKESSAPSAHNDSTAEVIYEGTNQEYTDIELDNNTTYHYAVFAYDRKPNYSKILTLSAQPEQGKESIPDENGGDDEDQATDYPEGTLIKIPESFKIYVIINQKKKWIPTPEVFETLGYQWTSITILNKTELDNLPDYEDNLIRAINDYKVYLVVNSIKRHIPNPQIFLNYGFNWEDVKDVPQSTINKYHRAHLIRESRQGKIYYLSSGNIKKHIPTSEIFNSYNNNWDDIQVISKPEMDAYPESNLIQLSGDDRIYLIEGNVKRWIPSAEIFNTRGFDWNHIIKVNEIELKWYGEGGEVR